jgi:Hint module
VELGAYSKNKPAPLQCAGSTAAETDPKSASPTTSSGDSGSGSTGSGSTGSGSTGSGSTGSGSTGSGSAGKGSAGKRSPGTQKGTSASKSFPSQATVLLGDGSTRRMEVAIGDSVHVGAGEFSAVYGFTHKDAAITSSFLRVHTAAGATLTATHGHYTYVNGNLLPMSFVQIGDMWTLASGEPSVVVAVETVVDLGLYNPQTVHGDVVIDGVLASTYTTAMAPGFAHAAVAPVRAIYALLGMGPSVFEQGAPVAVPQLLPSGVAVF